LAEGADKSELTLTYILLLEPQRGRVALANGTRFSRAAKRRRLKAHVMRRC